MWDKDLEIIWCPEAEARVVGRELSLVLGVLPAEDTQETLVSCVSTWCRGGGEKAKVKEWLLGLVGLTACHRCPPSTVSTSTSPLTAFVIAGTA